MPGLRDRKKDRTRAELVRCAVDLIKERGFDATTVDDITDCAEYSRSTFFRYFASKEDVLVQTPVKRMEDLVATLEAPGEDGDGAPLARLRAALTDGTVAVASGRNTIDHECYQLMMAEPSLAAGLAVAVMKCEEVLAAHLARQMGLPATDATSAMLAAAYLGVPRATLLVDGGDETTVRSFLEHGFDLLEHGYRSASGAGIRRLFDPPTQGRKRSSSSGVPKVRSAIAKTS